jgi:hypothetical protein
MTEIDAPNQSAISLLQLLNIDTSKDVETHIIFDWDDTLYPTTWMKSGFFHLIDNPLTANETIKKNFSQLSERIMYVINNAKKYGNVSIITNSREGWIEKSCILMPDLIPYIKTINIIYARDKHEHSSCHPEDWKKFEFEDIALKFIYSRKKIMKLICIGDSPHEHDAAKNVASVVNKHAYLNAYIKNIEFKYMPTFEELLIQVHNLATYIYLNQDNIITDMKSCTVKIPHTI